MISTTRDATISDDLWLCYLLKGPLGISDIECQGVKQGNIGDLKIKWCIMQECTCKMNLNVQWRDGKLRMKQYNWV